MHICLYILCNSNILINLNINNVYTQTIYNCIDNNFVDECIDDSWLAPMLSARFNLCDNMLYFDVYVKNIFLQTNTCKQICTHVCTYSITTVVSCRA